MMTTARYHNMKEVPSKQTEKNAHPKTNQMPFLKPCRIALNDKDAVNRSPVQGSVYVKRTQAFFHLHCVHHMSRFSMPYTFRHFLPSDLILGWPAAPW